MGKVQKAAGKKPAAKGSTAGQGVTHPNHPANQLQKIANGTTALTAPASLGALLMEDAGQGLQSMTRDDFAIPRLALLQALSPQVQARNAAYVDGAEVGMIYDNVSGELYNGQEGILLVIVSYRRAFLQWWPRNSNKGKGFIADHGLNDALFKQTTRSDKGENMLPDGSEIVPTAEYFAFLVDEQTGNFSRVLIPMAKTQLVKAKKLNTIASSLMVKVPGQGDVMAPFFLRTYRLRSAPQTNAKGNEWIGWEIEPGPALLPGFLEGVEVLPYGEKLYMEARTFHEQVLSGNVKVAKPVETDTGQSTGAGSDDAPM